jgi:hypothetical protein
VLRHVNKDIDNGFGFIVGTFPTYGNAAGLGNFGPPEQENARDIHVRLRHDQLTEGYGLAKSKQHNVLGMSRSIYILWDQLALESVAQIREAIRAVRRAD